MKKALIILALIATTAIAYCQPSAWPYDTTEMSAGDRILFWKPDNSTNIGLFEDLPGGGVDLFFAYGAGMSLAGDTVFFVTDGDKEFGYRKQIEDTLIITRIERDLSASDTLNYSYVYGDTIEDADVTILAVTAGGGQAAYTSFTNAKVPEGNYVWINVTGVVDLKNPVYFRSEIYGYIKRD